MRQPPSVMIKEFLTTKNMCMLSANEIESLAKSVLLPVSDIEIQLEHLRTITNNQKWGAAKAAATKKGKRKQTQQQQQVSCGVCGQQFYDEIEEVEYWIQCDACDMWYHWDCVHIFEEPESFVCEKC